MNDDNLLPISAAAAAAAAGNKLFGKGRYKLYALLAILLLACCSMLTGTVTLNSSAAADSGSDAPTRSDLDILEVEERERMVRKMWEVYSHNREIRLPRFWREAFEAAYEELASDEERVRAEAILEIARMSMQRSLDLESYKNTADERNHLSQGKAKVSSSSMFVEAQ